MGVSGLGELFEKQEIKLEALNNKILAIDAYNSIYQFLTTIRDYQGNLLQNPKGDITSHLIGLFYRNSTLTKIGIKPVYVFDGRPSELKRRTLHERGLAKRQAESKLQDALKKGDFIEVKKQSKRTARIDEVIVTSSKKLLELSGIPFIQALEEGESQCAYLEKSKLVDGVATQDYDAILFGANRIYRNVSVSPRRIVSGVKKEVSPEFLDVRKNLENLKLSRDQVTWLSLLMGTDFNEGVKGIGLKKGLILVTRHSSFKDIVTELKIDFDYEPLLDLFKKPKVIQVDSIPEAKADYPSLIDWLTNSNGFSKERVLNTINEVKEEKSKREHNLSKWF